MQVLAGKGPKLVLDLPAACFRPELEPSISAIMRHILEDPATLQAAMEAEIRATLSKQKTPANRSGDPLLLRGYGQPFTEHIRACCAGPAVRHCLCDLPSGSEERISIHSSA